METIAISKFKATCLAVLEEVRRSGRRVIVTRFGVPVAEVVPPSNQGLTTNWLGSLRGTGRVMGDIVSPASSEADWETLER